MPLFFVVISFDLGAIVDDPVVLAAVPAFLVVRGGPAFLLQRGCATTDRSALACYLATELPLVVVITGIGVETGRLKSATATAPVAAAMLPVLIMPLAADRLRRRAATA